MTKKKAWLTLGSLAYLGLSAWGGNDPKGFNVFGLIHIPPFFIAFSLITTLFLVHVLLKAAGPPICGYSHARRNPWRRIVVPALALIGLGVTTLALFGACLKMGGPPGTAENFLRKFGIY